MNYTIAAANRIVVKIGSSLLVDAKTGCIHFEWLKSLIEDIATCFKRKQQIIIVSSGAIALGRHHLNFTHTHLQLEEKQAAAAVGQIRLAQTYQSLLEAHRITVGQILLTLNDSENRRHYLNAKNTLETLIKLNSIPVINENDTVATAEIRFGDNDRLAARVAQMVSADLLVLLSDIDGLYTADPHKDPEAKLLPVVSSLTPEILAMAGLSSTAYGSGGMITKLGAAKIAMQSGCKMVIANGRKHFPLSQIDKSENKTWFIPALTPLNARKNWLATHLQPKGSIIIDAGAFKALQQGKSLLSVGILSSEGSFHKGDAVCVLTTNRQEVARGLINYTANEVQKIMGQKSELFEAILGYNGAAEIIHRDDLVMLSQKP